MGRTGKMWAHQHYSKDCTPDILTMSNPLANGMPIGAVMVTDDVAEKVSKGNIEVLCTGLRPYHSFFSI